MNRFLSFLGLGAIVFISSCTPKESEVFSFEFIGDTNITTSLSSLPVVINAESHTHLHNTGNQELTIGWELINGVDNPRDWEITVCDNIYCYVPTVTSGTMVLVKDNTEEEGRLKLNCKHNMVAGTGSSILRAWIVGDSANTVQQLTYNMNITL